MGNSCRRRPRPRTMLPVPQAGVAKDRSRREAEAVILGSDRCSLTAPHCWRWRNVPRWLSSQVPSPDPPSTRLGAGNSGHGPRPEAVQPRQHDTLCALQLDALASILLMDRPS